MPRVSRAATPSTTVNALAAHWSTDGRYDGTAASVATAAARWSRDEPASRPPRFAASIAPGPPPVATTRSWPSIQPSRAASAYLADERSRSCPPMTPTRCRPVTQPVSASSIAWSWSAWAKVTDGAGVRRDQA